MLCDLELQLSHSFHPINPNLDKLKPFYKLCTPVIVPALTRHLHFITICPIHASACSCAACEPVFRIVSAQKLSSREFVLCVLGECEGLE